MVFSKQQEHFALVAQARQLDMHGRVCRVLTDDAAAAAALASLRLRVLFGLKMSASTMKARACSS